MTIYLLFNLVFQEFLKRSWNRFQFQLSSFAPPYQKFGCFYLNFVETTISNVFFQNITLQWRSICSFKSFIPRVFEKILKQISLPTFKLRSFADHPESKSQLFCFEFRQNNNFECLFPKYYIAMASSINFRMSTKDRFPLSRDSRNRCSFVLSC